MGSVNTMFLQIKTTIRSILDRRSSFKLKALLGLLFAYGFSPIDFLTDAIPVVGILDDVGLLTVGLIIARRFIPSDIFDEYQEKYQEDSGPGLGTFLAVVFFLWLGILVLVWLALFSLFSS